VTAYTTATNAMRRLLADIGLELRARDITKNGGTPPALELQPDAEALARDITRPSGPHGPRPNARRASRAWMNGDRMRSREWIEEKREINELVREARAIERMISGGAG